jgi:chemotaxis protein histidine kinase CheA
MSNDAVFEAEMRLDFLNEVTILLDDCEESYLKIEDPSCRVEELAKIFRAVHSMKGAATLSYPLKIHAPALGPLNCLFNTAHEFGLLLLKADFDTNQLEDIFQILSQTYPTSNFKVMIDALKKTFSLELRLSLEYE